LKQTNSIKLFYGDLLSLLAFLPPLLYLLVMQISREEGFVSTSEGQVANELLEAYDKGDQEALEKVTQKQVFTFLEPEVLRFSFLFFSFLFFSFLFFSFFASSFKGCFFDFPHFF